MTSTTSISTTNTNSKKNKRRRTTSMSHRLLSFSTAASTAATSAVIAFMLSYGVTPAECFSGVSISTASVAVAVTPERTRTMSNGSTRRYFRNTADPSSSAATAAATVFFPETFLSTNQPSLLLADLDLDAGTETHPSSYMSATTSTATISPTNQPRSTTPPPPPTKPNQQLLPTWLRENKEALWESNWEQLRTAMLRSKFFTTKETLRLLTAIEQAARGDRHQMAGAAEFCLILVESMEMGLTALMAAAFHYCHCVTARHEMVANCSNSKQQHYNFYYSQQQDLFSQNNRKIIPATTYGDHVVASIAKDAARLKTLEMVAAKIYSDKATHRVTPDALDAQNLRMLLLSEAKDWRALAIRSAAALYRLKGILLNNKKTNTNELTPEALQVSREALHIYAPLASRLGMHRLKNELEGTAFRILYRRQYERVHRLARESRRRPRPTKYERRQGERQRHHATTNRGILELYNNQQQQQEEQHQCHCLDLSSCMRNVLTQVQNDMTHLLEQDEEFQKHVASFSVTARVKEPYSMWKKMLRNKCYHITQVPDAIALRIVLDAKHVPNNNSDSTATEKEDEDKEIKRARERELCYYAQNLCMEQWRPVQPNARYKDYIATPKPNGYQSLHYTAQTSWDDEDWNLEIQIRSGEMHQVAEFGLASHWDYKEAQQKNNYKNNHSKDGNKARPPKQQRRQQKQQQRQQQQSSIATATSTSHNKWHWRLPSGGEVTSASSTTKAPPSTAASATMTVDDRIVSPLDYYDDEYYSSNTGEFSSSFSVSSVFDDLNTRTSTSSSSAEQRVDRIRARTEKLQPYIEALAEAQSDLAREHVFVFLTFHETTSTCTDALSKNHHAQKQQQHQHTGGGQVLSLPAGACILDALREGEKHYGVPLFPWKEEDAMYLSINGQPMDKVTSKLQNGDILTVPGYSPSSSTSSSSSPGTALSP